MPAKKKPDPNLIRIRYLPASGWWHAETGTCSGSARTVEDAVKALCRIKTRTGHEWDKTRVCEGAT